MDAAGDADQEFVARTRSMIPEAGLALGTALSLLLALATYYFQAARSRTRALNRANARLTEDNARRQEAEQRLRESERRTQLIIDSVRDCAIYMLEVDGCIASWNVAAQELNGYWPDEIIGKHFSVLYPDDRIAPPESELAIAARAGWFEEECWHLRKDGTRYCGDDVISAIRDEQHELRGYAVVTRDATLRRELRHQTESARDHYLSLFSSFPNLVWRSDPTGACDYLNQAWLDYTGLSMESQEGDAWLVAVHPDDRAQWIDIIGRVFPTERPFELEFRLRRADGEFGWMICSARPYYAVNGEFSGYLVSCFDNTARRGAEDALKESEERYQRITTNVPGMVFKLKRMEGGDLQFLYASFGSRAVTGLAPDAIMGSIDTFLALLHDDDRRQLLVGLAESAKWLRNWVWAGRLQALSESEEKWISIRAKPRQSEGETVTWDGVVFDDSAAHLAQVELERSREESRSLSRHLQTIREEEKARIAREVHDELGSVLTGLKMDLDWLVEHQGSVSDGARQKYSAMRSLLASAVAATRKIVTDLRPSILDDLGLASAMRWQISEYQKHSPIEFALSTPNPEIFLDRARSLVLFRIFQEAMTNVTRHAKASRVEIDVAQVDSHVDMRIRDNGIGIADSDLRKRTSHGIRGMRERAEEIGGSLHVAADPAGGTVLMVEVPLAADLPEDASAPHA